MRKLYILILSALAVCSVNAQNISGLPQTRIMTPGVFHFAYACIDAGLKSLCARTGKLNCSIAFRSCKPPVLL